MQDFKKFINDAILQVTPTVNEFILDKIKNVLDSKKTKFTSKIDKDLLDLLNEKNTRSSQFITDDSIKVIYDEIIEYLNRHKISTTQNEKDNMLQKIKEVIENDKIKMQSLRNRSNRAKSF
jgi:hypothetical protein